ncbi:MAG: hypothetical protein ACSLEX_04315 [Minisyncoccota bacterium]|jgi:hypothetical protein
MSAEVIAFPQFSDSISAFCEVSEDPMIRTAPQWIQGCLELDQTLPPQFGWRFSNIEAFQTQVGNQRSLTKLNRAFWTDQARNVEAYSVMSMWRGAELLKPAIRSLNIGEVITSAVLARSLLELSTTYLLHANTIENLFSKLTFPPNTVVTSKEFEERVVKMIWGTRIGEPEPHLKQTNVLTLIQKLTKNQNAADLLPHYEFLCEIAHPNVVGNSRYWSHIERVNDDGSETRLLSRTADGEHTNEIRAKIIWSLAWSAGSLQNSFTMIHNALSTLLARLNKA